MDRELANRLNNLHTQNETLHKARSAYLLKEAERKHYEASLIMQAQGKSHAERENLARASQEWVAFARELAQLEAAFEYEKLKYDILDKAYLAEHLTAKLDADTIKRGA